MRDWSLKAGDPVSLSISADTRLSTPDYLNDHIWELELSGGEPRSLTIRTTYGLRARGMRLFFRFSEAGRVVVDPAHFHGAPRLRRFYPNFLLIDFVPLEGLEVAAEYWVPTSHVLAGRLTCVNRLPTRRRLEFGLCGLLTPLDGKSLGHAKHQMINVLEGRTGNLHPVVFMGGGPRHGADPHPSLILTLDFEPGTTRSVTWGCAAEATFQDAFDSARRSAARSWDAERARIEVLDARDVIEIHTGEPDWDAALAFTQKAAFRLLYPASRNLPHPSFVRSRQPDGGYSRAGDGSDYPPSWSGQTPLDAYYLASVFPLATEIKRGLLDNFLAIQTPDGTIDGRPGLAGQRSRFLATPLLASLAWNIHRDTPDIPALETAFSKLLAFFQAWFAPSKDPDGDGIPEWEHVLQTGLEDNPLFDVWYPWSQSVGISALSSPELEALLAREAASLISMAETVGKGEAADALRPLVARLASSVAASWNPRTSLFSYRDRITRTSTAGRLLGSCKGSGELILRRADLDRPARLLIEVERKSAAPAGPTIEILGWGIAPSTAAPDSSDQADTHGRLTERLEARRFQMHAGGLVATTSIVFEKVERISAEGLQTSDRLVVRTVDTTSEDITLFTPLWACLLSAEDARAVVDRLLREGEGFNRPFGIPALPATPASSRASVREKAEAEAVAMSVHLPWNQLIIEGLLAYGFREEAGRLTSRLMNAVVKSLKQNGAFYERYQAETGSGIGERGALTGLAPLGLFLQTLGVQFLSSASVRLEGRNPFPWPVTILHRGLRLVRGLEVTEVTFHNGQVVTVSDPAPCVVSL